MSPGPRVSYHVNFMMTDVTASTASEIHKSGLFRITMQMGDDHEHELPDDSDGDVEGVAREVRIRSNYGVFLEKLLINRSPVAPGADGAVESFEHVVAFRAGPKAYDSPRQLC